MTLADQIKRKRLELNYTQAQLGMLLGTRDKNISTWETGKANPTGPRAEMVHKWLNEKNPKLPLTYETENQEPQKATFTVEINREKTRLVVARNMVEAVRKALESHGKTSELRTVTIQTSEIEVIA